MSSRIKVQEIGISLSPTGYRVVFRYWHEDDCACGAVRAVRFFTHKPSEQDLIQSIGK